MKSSKKACLGMMLSTLLLIVLTSTGRAYAVGDDSNKKEVGIWWIKTYNGHGGDLLYTQLDAEGFYNALYNGGWTKSMELSNNNAKESDFERFQSSDVLKADSVDIFYFAGHGNYPYLCFSTNYDVGDGVHPYQLYANSGYSDNEPSWGDTDLEWAVMHACLMLGTSASQAAKWNDAFQGLHGICGFRTDAYDVSNLGNDMAVYLKQNRNFTYSWRWATYWDQPQTAFSALYCANIRIDALNYVYGIDDRLNSMLPDYDNISVLKTGYTYYSWQCYGGPHP